MDPGFMVGEWIAESMVVTSALNTGVLGRPITATAVEVSDLRVTSFFLQKNLLGVSIQFTGPRTSR